MTAEYVDRSSVVRRIRMTPPAAVSDVAAEGARRTA